MSEGEYARCIALAEEILEQLVAIADSQRALPQVDGLIDPCPKKK